MSANQTINPTKTLANDSRAQLEPWLEEFETHTVVASDDVWNSITANQTTAVRIAVGDPSHRARLAFDQPQSHANNVAAAVVSLFKMEATRHADYSMASSTLNTARLASVGENNRNHLQTTFPALKLHMLSPREIVDTMRANHGVATSDDISRLQDPLSRALTSLSDFTDHVDSFLLASPASVRHGAAKGKSTTIISSSFLKICRASPLCRLVLPDTTPSVML
jgi:hypothetical protein